MYPGQTHYVVRTFSHPDLKDPSVEIEVCTPIVEGPCTPSPVAAGEIPEIVD
jgi:hypothetical protein